MPTIDNIRAALAHVLRPYDVREAYIYGSYARNEQTRESDIDLRLLCGQNISYGDLYRINQDLEKRLGTRVDILTCHPDKLRPSFYQRIKNDEVKLYAVN